MTYKEIFSNPEDFVDFFNRKIRAGKNRKYFPNSLGHEGFSEVMQNIEKLTGKKEISPSEFCGHFAIIYNETGGLFKPMREHGGARYMFNTTMPNGQRKHSYNKYPNRLAGNLLKERGFISSDHDVKIWNEQSYPNKAHPKIKEASKDCDFFKYRGGGYNQLTWRTNYKKCLQPLLKRDIDEMTDKEITELFQDVNIACQVFHNFISGHKISKQAIQELEKGNFTPYGYLVSGGWRWYVNKKYLPRCEKLLKGLRDLIWNSLMEKEFSIESLNRPEIEQVQEKILNLDNAKARSIINNSGGADGILGGGTRKAFSFFLTNSFI